MIYTNTFVICWFICLTFEYIFWRYINLNILILPINIKLQPKKKKRTNKLKNKTYYIPVSFIYILFEFLHYIKIYFNVVAVYWYFYQTTYIFSNKENSLFVFKLLYSIDNLTIIISTFFMIFYLKKTINEIYDNAHKNNNILNNNILNIWIILSFIIYFYAFYNSIIILYSVIYSVIKSIN